MGLRRGQPARLARTHLASLVFAALALLAALPVSAAADPSIEVSRERVAAGEKIVVEGDDWASRDDDRRREDDDNERGRDRQDEELEVTLYLATEQDDGSGDDEAEEGEKLTDDPVEVEDGRFRVEVTIPDNAKPGSTKLLARADGDALKAERRLEITGERGQDATGPNGAGQGDADLPVPSVLPTAGEEEGAGEDSGSGNEGADESGGGDDGSSRRSRRPSGGGDDDDDKDRDKNDKGDDDEKDDKDDKRKGDKDKDDEEAQGAPVSSRQPPFSDDPGEGGGGLAWYVIVGVVGLVAAALAALPMIASRWLSLSEPADTDALPPTSPLT